jgi:DNA-binding NtrC family response regulator
MQHILVVDDEEDLIQSAQNYLEQQGYRVTAFTNAGEACDFTKRESIDAVITDFRMPNMNGRELLSCVRQRHPDVPVIILSGFTYEVGINEDHRTKLVQKPCRLNVLQDMLYVMLAAL